MLPPRSDAKVSSVYPKDPNNWIQRDYFRRRGLLRRSRGLLGLAVAIGCVALALVIPFWPGGRRAFQAAPVSEAHASFNDRCAVCHTSTFTAAARLVRGDERSSVADAACTRCHEGPAHHSRQLASPACASCHREHHGSGPMARVDDRHCTACHAHLSPHSDENVSGFIGKLHPPFRAWRGKTDPGTIRFSHQAHLKPEGVPVVGIVSGRRVLTCRDCHHPDQERRYPQPIGYQRDCAGCHPLAIGIAAELADEKARSEARNFQATPLPHPAPGESPGMVRAEVRERLIRFIQGNPAVLGRGEGARGELPIPGRERRGPAPVTGAEWQWVGHELARIEHSLFDGAGGCRYCHTELTDPTDRAEGLPRYAPPALKARWFPHSIFKHDSHRELDCQECHRNTDKSVSAAQILMPEIATCQKCHTPATQGARTDCVACHTYHNRREESRTGPGLTIGEALAPDPHR